MPNPSLLKLPAQCRGCSLRTNYQSPPRLGDGNGRQKAPLLLQMPIRRIKQRQSSIEGDDMPLALRNCRRAFSSVNGLPVFRHQEHIPGLNQ